MVVIKRKCIASDNIEVSSKYFSYFSTKTYVVGAHLMFLWRPKVLQMITHNIYFCGDKKKIGILSD